MDEGELKVLKDQLAAFYAKKSNDLADKEWKEKNLSSEDMDQWLNEE
nr:hypothetical protein [Bacteroidota bacterium]